MISWCSHTLQAAVSVSRGYGGQYRLHSTAQLVRQRVGPTIDNYLWPYMQGAGGARDHVVFAWEIESRARGSLTVKNELNLLADRSSLFIPMAEGGGCYGCLTLCNAIIFCVVHARGPVDPRP